MAAGKKKKKKIKTPGRVKGKPPFSTLSVIH